MLRTSGNKKYNILVMILLLLTSGILVSCGDDDGNGTEPEPVATATVKGRVTDDSGYNQMNKTSANVEGAAVFLAEMQADGTLETVSTDTVTTNAGGEYTLETELSGKTGLVAVAVKGNMEWRTVISSEVTHDETIYAPPMNEETTAEQKTYNEAQEKELDDAEYPDYTLYIDSEVAVEVNSNSQAAAGLATAINAQAQAENRALNNSYIGATQAQITQVNNAKQNAQLRLESDLYFASGNSTAIEDAFDLFYNSYIDAYTDAEIDASAFAKARSAAVSVMLKNTADLGADTKMMLRKQAMWIKAKVISNAMVKLFEDSDASQSRISAVSSAGLSLRSSISSASTTSDIEQAFMAYHDNIVDQLELYLSSQSEAVLSVDSTINASGSFKSVLVSSVNAGAFTNVIVDAYISFYNSVENSVEETFSSASSSEISLAAQVLILANMYVSQ